MMALWSAGDASGRWMLSGMRLTYSTYYAYFLTHAGDASRGAAAESHLYVGARRTAQLRLMLRLVGRDPVSCIYATLAPARHTTRIWEVQCTLMQSVSSMHACAANGVALHGGVGG